MPEAASNNARASAVVTTPTPGQGKVAPPCRGWRGLRALFWEADTRPMELLFAVLWVSWSVMMYRNRAHPIRHYEWLVGEAGTLPWCALALCSCAFSLLGVWLCRRDLRAFGAMFGATGAIHLTLGCALMARAPGVASWFFTLSAFYVWVLLRLSPNRHGGAAAEQPAAAGQPAAGSAGSAAAAAAAAAPASATGANP